VSLQCLIDLRVESAQCDSYVVHSLDIPLRMLWDVFAAYVEPTQGIIWQIDLARRDTFDMCMTHLPTPPFVRSLGHPLLTTFINMNK
jgi:hypothetical protein